MTDATTFARVQAECERSIVRSFSVPAMILGPVPDPPAFRRLRQMVRLGYFTLPAGTLDHLAVRRAIDEAGRWSLEA